MIIQALLVVHYRPMVSQCVDRRPVCLDGARLRDRDRRPVLMMCNRTMRQMSYTLLIMAILVHYRVVFHLCRAVHAHSQPAYTDRQIQRRIVT